MVENEISYISYLGYKKVMNSKELIKQLTTSLDLENKSPYFWEDLFKFEELIEFYQKNELTNLLMNIKEGCLYIFPEITEPLGDYPECSSYTVGSRENTEVFIVSDRNKFIRDINERLVDDYYMFDDSFTWIIAVTHEEQDNFGRKVIYLKNK